MEWFFGGMLFRYNWLVMIQKNLFAAIALLLISQSGAFSAPVGLDGLKAGFERKLGEVLQPVTERHVKALANLEQALTRNQKLEEALLVRQERVRISLLEGSDVITELADSPKQLEVLNSRFRREALSVMRPWELKYEKALRDLLTVLQRAAKLEEALHAKKEIEAFEKSIKMRGINNDEDAREASVNVALASSGSKAEAPKAADLMIDGKVRYGRREGFSWGYYPCDFVVKFRKAETISKIRFLLFELEKEWAYTYKIYIQRRSGGKWELLADHSKKQSKGWQEHSFNPRIVAAVKVEGLGNSGNKQFHIVELEAR